MPKSDGAKEKREKYVQFFDLDTKKVSQIPLSKLTLNMMRAKIEGMPGIYWIDASKVELDEHKYHQSFSEEIREQIRQIMLKLKEVHSLSFDEWEDGFLKDKNAEGEISLWLHTADVYSRFTTKRPLSLEQKNDVFEVLRLCMRSDKQTIFHLLRPMLLTKAELQEIVFDYFRDTM
ncbi:MAG TPA: hypothetical protein VF648_03200 [Pyrinomonadaceae bacterium]|jgi:hypothetical protein